MQKTSTISEKTVKTGLTVSPYHLKEETRKTYIYPVTAEADTVEAPPKRLPKGFNLFASAEDPSQVIITVPSGEIGYEEDKLTFFYYLKDLYRLLQYAHRRRIDFIIIPHEDHVLRSFFSSKANNDSDIITEATVQNAISDDIANLPYYDTPSTEKLIQKFRQSHN